MHRLSITDFLDAQGISYRESGQHHHTRPGWIQLENCPSCGSDNYHLGINLESLVFCCWRCGKQSASQVLTALHVPAKNIRLFWNDVRAEPGKRIERKAVQNLVEPKHRGPLKQAHRNYLRGRGFDPDHLVKLWNIEGIGIDSRLPWRIYIPIYVNGERVSWTARAIGDVDLRYISASESEEIVPHKHCLYGEDNVNTSVVIVEGPTDVWKLGPGAVATFGTAFTPAQVRRLSRYPSRWILFDNEAVAQRQAHRLAKALSCFPGVTHVLNCDAKDPGMLKAKQVAAIRRLASL